MSSRTLPKAEAKDCVEFYLSLSGGDPSNALENSVLLRHCMTIDDHWILSPTCMTTHVLMAIYPVIAWPVEASPRRRIAFSSVSVRTGTRRRNAKHVPRKPIRETPLRATSVDHSVRNVESSSSREACALAV